MELKKHIGLKIKELRLQMGMNQDQLADKLDTTKQTVSRYENGIRQVNQDILFQLADIFGKSVDDFFPNKKGKNELERALEMTDGLELDEMEFINKLIEKTLSLKGSERESFLESMKFTIEYHEKMNED